MFVLNRKLLLGLGYFVILSALTILAISNSKNMQIWQITTLWFGFGALYILFTYNRFKRPLTLVESIQMKQYQIFKGELQKDK